MMVLIDVSTVSIAKNFIQEVNFEVYPNPTKDVLNISTKEETELVLYDMSGREIQNFKVNENKVISIGNLDAGLYILRDKYTNSSRKIIKK